jgi:cytochrome P450
MAPALHKRMVAGYAGRIVRQVDRVSARWPKGGAIDALVEMRRIALLSIVDSLFGVDAGKDMARLWRPLLKTLAYISPGPWLVWRDMPRPGYRRALRRMDAYLYAVIRARRRADAAGADLLGLLLEADLPDDLITMLIAGHDTSTALLAWALALLGGHPAVLARARQEVDEALGSEPPAAERLDALPYLGQVIDETLRLYPPIHLGNRIAMTDLTFGGYRIPEGRRVLYSIYLAHRDPAHWPEPARFDPERFSAANKRGRAPYTYLPFGGGRRNCIGYAFAEVEARVCLLYTSPSPRDRG